MIFEYIRFAGIRGSTFLNPDDFRRAIENARICIQGFVSRKCWVEEFAEMAKMNILPVFYQVTPDDVKMETDLYTKHLSAQRLEKKAFLSIHGCKGCEHILTNSKSDEECCREIVKMLKLKQEKTSKCFVVMFIEITDAMWGDCNFYPEMGLEELSAMRINKFCKYGQIRDLGRDTVCHEELTEVCSRLRMRHDAEMLKRGIKGESNIKAIRVLNDTKSSYDRGGTCTVTADKLGGLNEVRFLEIHGEIKWDGIWHLMFPNLLWLPNLKGSILCVELVVLNLSGCDITEEWEGWREIKELSHLKVLNLSYCHRLTKLPDWIGSLKTLEILSLCGMRIRVLPESIGEMVNLERLIMKNCCEITNLPDSIGGLVRLEALDFSGCSKLSRLPTLTQLTSLKELDVGSCDYIEDLPMLPASLTSLQVTSESLQRIADLSHLTKLKSLLISNKRDEIKAAARGRKPRVELPVFNIEWIGGLPELTELYLTISKIATIPTKFCALSQLKQFTLQYSELQCSLPLPYNLSNLNLSHLKGSKSLYVSLLKNLKAFSLSSCEDLTEIPGLGELESLQSLYIYNCTSLDRLDDISKLRKLKSLELTLCSNVRDIHGLWGLESLVKLDIDMCNSLERLTAPPPLLLCNNSTGESKTTAARLDVFISRCDMLKDLRGVEELVSVRSITIKDSSSLERLFDVSRWRYLTKLTFQKCVKLREVQGLEELESVKELVIQDCSCLEMLPNLSNLRLLERLHVEKCKKLKAIEGLESAFLKYLHISYCKSLEWLGIDPREMNRLEYLCIEFCQNLREIHNGNNPQLLKINSSEEDGSSNSTTTTSTSFDPVVASCSSTEAMQTCLDSDDSKAAAKAILKGFFCGGIEMLASDLVPVMAAAKALSQVMDQTDGDSFWKEELCSTTLQQASSSYKEILESIKAAEVSHANYAKLKESAVEMRDNYFSVKSQMDCLQTTKEKTLSEIDTLQASLVETDQQLQIAASKRQLLVTAMKEQIHVMKAAQEEIQALDAQRDASQANFIALKTQWDFWAAQALLLHLG